MYAVTGASGQLGRLVVEELLKRVPADKVAALTRDPSTLTGLAGKGVAVRAFDFDKPETLPRALAGVDRLLLVSSPKHGKRVSQHRGAIEAAKEARVNFIAYTSVLHADTSPLIIAEEHRLTEEIIKNSGINYALLRHGWYAENITYFLASDIARGTIRGSAGDGRESSITRADLAAADVAILLDESINQQTFELAGDVGYTRNECAAMLSEVSGKSVTYTDMTEAEFKEALLRDGWPEAPVSIIAQSSAVTKQDVLFDGSRTVSKLIGRPTTSLRVVIQEAVAKLQLNDKQ